MGLWTIPKTKNGEAHTIPLVSQALEILKIRIQNKKNEWVFASHSKSGHFSDPKKTWKRTLERAGISDLRIHDLRRSLGSWQASTGASLVIIGKTLAHRNVGTTSIYARLNIDPVRDADGHFFCNKLTGCNFPYLLHIDAWIEVKVEALEGFV